MRKILPDGVVGALAGLALGILASFSLVVFTDPAGRSPNYASIVLGLVGAVCGGLVSGRDQCYISYALNEDKCRPVAGCFVTHICSL